jgi:hypothetical protein
VGNPLFDDLSYYSGDLSDDASTGPSLPSITEQDVSTHIKGSLSFGLPKKLMMKTKLSSVRPSRPILLSKTSIKKPGPKKNVGRSSKSIVGDDKDLSNGAEGVGEGGSCETSGGLLVHRPVVPRKKETINIDHLSEELQQGYK